MSSNDEFEVEKQPAVKVTGDVGVTLLYSVQLYACIYMYYIICRTCLSVRKRSGHHSPHGPAVVQSSSHMQPILKISSHLLNNIP